MFSPFKPQGYFDYQSLSRIASIFMITALATKPADVQSQANDHANVYYFLYHDESKPNLKIVDPMTLLAGSGTSADEAWKNVKQLTARVFMGDRPRPEVTIPCEAKGGWTAYVTLFDGDAQGARGYEKPKFGVGVSCGLNSHSEALTVAWSRASDGLKKEGGGAPKQFLVYAGRLARMPGLVVDEYHRVQIPSQTFCRSDYFVPEKVAIYSSGSSGSRYVPPTALSLTTQEVPKLLESAPREPFSSTLIGKERCYLWMGKAA